MDAPIISRELIRSMGIAAFAAGRGRNAHNMNPGSPAISEWQAGWDTAYKAKSAKTHVCTHCSASQGTAHARSFAIARYV